MEQPSRSHLEFALCIENTDCDDLEKGKVYPVFPDDSAARDGYLRIVDASGEDYLYPETCFVPLTLPPRARDALRSMPNAVCPPLGRGCTRTSEALP